MAATTNRRFTELYRNSTVFETKQAAITGLYNHELINSLKDGEPLLARYMAYFTWDEGSKQYVLQSTKNDSATFTRIVSNETSVTSTKEYIVGDIINVTATEGNITTTKSYKCSSIPQGGVAVPVGSNFATSGYFTEITSASVTPQSVKTIRVLMAVATVFEDNSGNPSFKKEPPKGRLTIFEEDDAIREMINKASISSPDGTINISDAVSGKEIQVNLGTSLVKNTTTGVDRGKIDVNFDDRTIKQHPSSHSTLPNKLYVHHGNTIVESDISGEEGKLNVHHGSTLVESSDSEHLGMLDVNTGVTLKVSDGTGSGPASGTIDVYHGATLVESNTSGEVGKLDVRTGTSLKVSNGGPDNPDPGTIDVNIDDVTIKQNTTDNKLYVNVNPSYGLESDSSDGIKVRLGEALAFRTGDSTTSNNGKIDVKYDDNTIGLNNSNQLTVNFHSGTMERKSHESAGSTVYDGWGVKHDNTITEINNGLHVNIDDTTIYQKSNGLISVKHDTSLNEDATNGISVNIDGVTIKKDGTNNDALTVNHDTSITVDSTNGIGVNIDDKSIKQIESGTDQNKLYVNIDNLTIKEYPSDYATSSLQDKLYVNIDNNTLVSDPSTGVISVNSAATSIFGENAIEIENHTTGSTVDGKTVKLNIDRTDDTGDPNVLSQSAAGLKVNLNLRQCTSAELAELGTNVKEAYKLVGNAGSSETQIGSVIKIYKDSSLYRVYLGHVDDTIDSNDPPTVTPGTGSEALCFIYLKADGTYELVAVDVESFLQESEFKDGLTVNYSTHEVSANLWDGLVIHPITGKNGAIQAKIGNGIQFGTGDEGKRPFEIRTGNGLEFGTGDEGKKPVGAKIGNGLEFGTGSEGQKPVEVRLGSGLSFDEGTEQSPITDGVRPIKVNIGEGLAVDNNNIKVNLGTGLGFDATTGNEGKIYINYATIGAANRPVYWDGTNHTPVQIDYEINKTVPADAVFTDTTYSSGNEITIDSTNNHINHDVKLTGGFTPTSSSVTISGWGASDSISIPLLTVNEYGHVTSASGATATLTVTMPEAKIIDNQLEWPDYTTTHLSPAWQTVITENAIALNTPYDTAFNKLDKKIKGLADELINAESVWSQAIEDEPRYFAKSTDKSEASSETKTATLVDSRNFATENGKPINGTKVDVYFSTSQTSTKAKLEINNTGSYALIYNDSDFDTTLIEAGTTLALVFDKEYNNNAGCYRVVGGVGSGSDSTNGITHVNGGNGTVVTKNYTEVTINSAGTIYTSNWFNNAKGTAVITPVQNVVYRVITNGNYYNMAYTWNGSRYVLSTSIEETVAARLGNGLVFGTGTDGQKPIEINLAANMIPEGSTSGSATEIGNLGTLLKFTTEGKLAMENTWDCGTY